MLKKIKNFIKSIPYSSFLYGKVTNFVLYVKYWISFQRQKKIYRRVCLVAKQNKRKLKVAFLVNENEKWCCQYLYDKLKRSKHFDPVIFLTSYNDFKRKDITKKLTRNIEFFNKYCGNVQLVYNNETKQFDDLNKYNLDIIFYQQHWGIAKNQNLFSTSKFALSMYIPYAFVDSYYLIEQYKYSFYYLLFRFYITHDLIMREYENNGYKRENLKVSGYPKLEEYLDDKNYEKKYVIYAPHHSFAEDSLRLGTFGWNGTFILDYAKKHKEFNWIFKPHPLCKDSLIRAGIFKDINEVNSYYDEWEKIGYIYDKGNYINLFKQTKCLITDCGSFLIEFLPTESPVINLRRKDSVCLSNITDKIVKSYYQAYNLEELKQYFNDILENNNDPKKEERLSLIKKLNLVRNASDNIINDLEETFYKNIR